VLEAAGGPHLEPGAPMVIDLRDEVVSQQPVSTALD
jgi:hypothetical protein